MDAGNERAQSIYYVTYDSAERYDSTWDYNTVL
jgi:hypothetical protein